jgi:hypothetical protein
METIETWVSLCRGIVKAITSVEYTRIQLCSNPAEFEVLTAVVMKSIILWDITPCSPLSFNRCYGGTYRLHLQGRRIVQQTSEQAGGKQNTFLRIVGYNSMDYTASYPIR